MNLPAMRRDPSSSLVGIVAMMLLSVGCAPDEGISSDTDSANLPCINFQQGIDCVADVEVRLASTGAIVTNGQTVEVASVGGKIGSTVDLRFKVTNVGAVASASLLRVRKITLDYDAISPDESAGLAFRCYKSDGLTPCDKANFTPVAPSGLSPAGSGHEEGFIIRYTRYDDVVRRATVQVTLAGDPGFYAKTYNIKLTTDLGTPRLTSSPSVLDFQEVAPDDTSQKKLTLINAGDAPLVVKRLEFEGSKSFRVITPDGKSHKPDGLILFKPELRIAPQGSIEVKVLFSPADPYKKQGLIRIVTNDVSKAPPTVPLIGNSAMPCMQVTPAGELNFGGTKVGMTQSQKVVIGNCGSAELVVSKIDFGLVGNSDEFTFDFSAMKTSYPKVDAKSGPTTTAPLRIAVNGSATFSVIYSPEDESAVDESTGQKKPDIAEILFASNAFASKSTLLCKGVGVTESCPLAKVKVVEGEEVIPQTMLHLIGDQSQSWSPGGIAKYQWVVTQPTGSKQLLVPSAKFANPTFKADSAGLYKFCLTVWDQTNVQSCAPACKEVLVTPDQAIHVELHWDTPADPDQTDEGPGAGADMDLHFAHPLAAGPDIDCDGAADPWFSNPFDTFWFNKNPNWGSAAKAADDPSLDLDDTNGAGPENLNLDEPEGSLTKPVAYHVGVHYWDDHGFEKSFATVKIYIQAVLVLKIDNVAMMPLDMWHVAKIHWPNTMVNTAAVSDPVQVCKGAADLCGAGKGGKKWALTGDWCMTPCYVKPGFTAGQGTAPNPACSKP
ncbi:MAG: choice-of-anchor D domain-containing protein [Myxococcales bacterium]|nr:choice-of-anchor D domain-containing protein [Myxococcales bacterium]